MVPISSENSCKSNYEKRKVGGQLEKEEFKNDNLFNMSFLQMRTQYPSVPRLEMLIDLETIA